MKNFSRRDKIRAVNETNKKAGRRCWNVDFLLMKLAMLEIVASAWDGYGALTIEQHEQRRDEICGLQCKGRNFVLRHDITSSLFERKPSHFRPANVADNITRQKSFQYKFQTTISSDNAGEIVLFAAVETQSKHRDIVGLFGVTDVL